MHDKKNWYAVITADVLYDASLSARQKLLYAIISNMSNEKGYCFASNKTLAELSGVSPSTIKRDLSVLEENYITRVVHLKPDGQVDFRALTPVSHMRGVSSLKSRGEATDALRVGSPVDGGGFTHEPGGGFTSEPYNNKDYNNKLKNKTNNKEKKVFKDFSDRGDATFVWCNYDKYELYRITKGNYLNSKGVEDLILELIEDEGKTVVVMLKSYPLPF